MTENENDGLTPTNQVKTYLLAASKLGAWLFRRNVGMGWIGDAKRFNKTETVPNFTFRAGDVLIRNARPFHNGEKGQSDLWGFRQITITADMVGTKMLQPVEAEAKQGTGRLTPEQENWINFVNAMGGRAGVVRSLDDLAKLLAG